MGTLRYASPEQVLAAGNLDGRSDVYSLGATMWELLTLQPIFGASEETPTPELMMRIQTKEVERIRRHNPQVPPDLEAISLKCLEKDPARRYATAAELAEDLARWQRGEPVYAQAATLAYVFSKYARRHKLQFASIAAILLALIVGVAAAFYRINRARSDAEEAQVKAEKARTAAEQANRDTETAVFDMYTASGIRAGEEGNASQAILWFTRASTVARHDADRQRANRTRIATWIQKAPRPVRVLPLWGLP